MNSSCSSATRSRSRWHWGVNFVWEAETGWDREQEFQIPAGLSYSLIDGKFGVGVEVLYDHDTVKDARGHPAHQFNVGPSIQFRPTTTCTSMSPACSARTTIRTARSAGSSSATISVRAATPSALTFRRADGRISLHISRSQEEKM